ncbi:P-loop NTPase fold protein [Achromobacter xylosoxidans]
MNSPEKWNPGMDLNASRNALTQFLENGKGQVLGLSGRWGAGKTHLWLSLRDTLPAAKTALYASCFGLKSPDEIGTRSCRTPPATPPSTAKPAARS